MLFVRRASGMNLPSSAWAVYGAAPVAWVLIGQVIRSQPALMGAMRWRSHREALDLTDSP